MKAADKIDNLLKYLEINAKVFSEKLGYDRPQIIYDLQKGKTKRISEELGSKIVSVFPQVSRAWLMAGEGDMLVGAKAPAETKEDTRPRIPVAAAAGTLAGFAAAIKAEDCEMVPVIKAFPSYDYTMIVKGNSMEPKYEGGDEIAIRRVSSTIEWGKAYVLDTRDGAVIKRLYDAGDQFRCVSYNAEYPDFYVDKSEVFGVYKVVGLIRI